MPDNENGRYALSPVTDGVIRLDTRTGAVSTCTNTGTGWACYAVPDERAASMRKSAGCRPTMKSSRRARAAREPDGRRQDRRSAAEIGLAEKGRTEGGRERAQDRNPAAERPRHGSGDVVPRTGLAAAGRDGQPDAEGCQRQDLRMVVPANASDLQGGHTSIFIDFSRAIVAIDRSTFQHRLVAS